MIDLKWRPNVVVVV